MFSAEPELGPWTPFSECMLTTNSSTGDDECPQKGGERVRTRECLPAGVCPDCDNMAISCMCNGTLSESEPCDADGQFLQT